MERVDYVTRKKPEHEIPTRLHHMIYLSGCEAGVRCEALYAEYADWRRRNALYPREFWIELSQTIPGILAYIKQHIPDCAWNGRQLVFPPGPSDT